MGMRRRGKKLGKRNDGYPKKRKNRTGERDRRHEEEQKGKVEGEFEKDHEEEEREGRRWKLEGQLA